MGDEEVRRSEGSKCSELDVRSESRKMLRRGMRIVAMVTEEARLVLKYERVRVLPLAMAL